MLFEAAPTAALAIALSAAYQGKDGLEAVEAARATFSEMENLQLSPISVDSAITNAALLARNQIGHSAELFFDLDAKPLVYADPGRLEQVIVNLLRNAYQAVQDSEDRRICVRTHVVSENHVAIEVSDSGVGIPAENLERVFDPFFTTRNVGDGTGLGLSLCHELVSQLSGTIELQSTVGVGTTVRVILPLADCRVASLGASRCKPIGSPGPSEPAFSAHHEVLDCNDARAKARVLFV